MLFSGSGCFRRFRGVCGRSVFYDGLAVFQCQGICGLGSLALRNLVVSAGVLYVRTVSAVEYLDVLGLKYFDYALFSSLFLCLDKFQSLFQVDGIWILSFCKGLELAVIFYVGSEPSDGTCNLLAIMGSHNPWQFEQLYSFLKGDGLYGLVFPERCKLFMRVI